MSSNYPPHSKSSSSDPIQALCRSSQTESDHSELSAFSSPTDSSPQTVFLAQLFDSESEFTAFVLKKLEAWYQTERNYTEYLFTEVPLLWEKSVFTAIDKIERTENLEYPSPDTTGPDRAH